MRPDVIRDSTSVLTRASKDHHDHIDNFIATPAVRCEVEPSSHTGIISHAATVDIVGFPPTPILTISGHRIGQHDWSYHIEDGFELSPTLLLEIVGHATSCPMIMEAALVKYGIPIRPDFRIGARECLIREGGKYHGDTHTAFDCGCTTGTSWHRTGTSRQQATVTGDTLLSAGSGDCQRQQHTYRIESYHFLGHQGFRVLKKSLPLSSTRMNAGKSSTSIFHTASMPSSGYSTHSMLLIELCESTAATPPIEPR